MIPDLSILLYNLHHIVYMQKRYFLSFLLLISFTFVRSQIGTGNHVDWNISIKKTTNNQYEIIGEALPHSGWHVYSAFLPENTAIPTTITINPGLGFKAVGGIVEQPAPETHFDESFKAELKWHSKKATFTQKIEVTQPGKINISGFVEYMVCNDETCMPPDQIEFNFTVEGAEPAANTAPRDNNVKQSTDAASIQEQPLPTQLDDVDQTQQETTQVNQQQISQHTNESADTPHSYWSIFFIAFIAGFAALLTPCVFPMIPMTVSFFTKQSKTKAKGIRNAVLYGISIIVIYLLLGTVVTAVFGAGALNALASEPLFNLFFFLLLIVFAISFFGAFEIVLPASWVNAADKNADKGGLIGIFFMAFTLALVSFSCTGPIVGTIIVEAARNGGLAPVIGMFGFSLAIALPFTFFAAFPGYLNSLPKSGGWLNSVKVVLGFLELAFAFKFLSNADMALDLHILERELFLAIWIAIFGTLALYLFGKIKLPHDSNMEHLPVSRMILGIVVLAFTIYLIPGLWGAPVKLISGFPPSSNYAESPMGVGREGTTASLQTGTALGSLPAGMHLGPQGIPAFEDLKPALEYAKLTNKPLMLDFTGKTCVNCRKMEDNVWSDAEVKKLLTNDYILVSLYVDLRTALPDNQIYTSKETGKKIRNIGQKWADYQLTHFQIQGQPYYVLMTPEQKVLNQPMAFNLDVEQYRQWLQEGLTLFRQ